MLISGHLNIYMQFKYLSPTTRASIISFFIAEPYLSTFTVKLWIEGLLRRMWLKEDCKGNVTFTLSHLLALVRATSFLQQASGDAAQLNQTSLLKEKINTVFSPKYTQLNYFWKVYIYMNKSCLCLTDSTHSLYIYIYIYIVIHRQTVSFYQNSSVWLDTQDARSRDRNPSNFTLD